MKYLLTIFFFTSILFAQNNVTLLGSLNPHPTGDYNDIWGYVDGNGNEYALLGCESGTSVINLTDPTNPSEVAFIPGTGSVWRDIKVWDSYAYVVSDFTSDGLQIIDLSQLPATATLAAQLNTWFDRAHNIFIDNGYAYAIGTEGGGGMHILDLSNATSPTQTAYYTAGGYIHDVYVWDDTVVTCNGSSQFYQLVSVSNKFSPQVISTSSILPSIYAHSGWMTEDNRYFVAMEEFNERDLTVWDLQDRTSWDLIVPNWHLPTGNSIIHNCFVRGDFVHIAYYTSGYVVLDISNPSSPQVAGQYDTYPANDGATYNGAWGCYPYLPSGIVLVSDIQTGLYVFNFDGEVPVELNSFIAEAEGSTALLSWNTASETNNEGFELQKKSGNEFQTIAFIPGAGTTTETQNYFYTDKDLTSGIYTYRLKQLDFDGSFEYSEEISVEVITPSEFILLQNYPNPFNPLTKIKYSIPENSFVNLSVFNMLGEKVAEIVNSNLPAGEYEADFNAISLPSGIYMARLDAAGNVSTIKMNLIK